jgi:hypothetical protein
MTTTQVSFITAIVTAIVTVIPLAVAAFLKLQEALKPILQKRKLKVIVLCTETTQAAAAAFLMSLRAAAAG